MSVARAKPPRNLARHGAYALNLAIFLLALVTIAIVVNYFAQRHELRYRIDATKTRAYSLSEQTRQLLAKLEGEWTIGVILVERMASDAMQQQVEEVLERYRDATPAISVVRVDPTDPASLPAYEALLARLRETESAAIGAYETALDDGVDAFERLRVFAQRQSGQLEQVLAAVAADDPRREQIQQRLGLIGLLAGEGGQVLDAVRDARVVGETQPMPDYETARSILAQALSQWANELDEMARIYSEWVGRTDVAPLLVRFAGSVRDDYRAMAQQLAVAADPLAQLPELEIAAIGRALAEGEAAVVIGPDRSAVIGSAQLFPKLNVREVGGGAVAYDQRFRGEQVISAGIRSLLVPRMPMVVFVHGGERSMLRRNEQNADVAGVAALLHASRFEVREWRVAAGDRPVPAEAQRAVWVVIPPAQRQGLEPDPTERALLRAVSDLVADGEPVLLSVYPSLLPRYRQPDPWQRLAEDFGVRPDTANAVYQVVQNAEGQPAYERGQAVRRFTTAHPICDAVNGQQAYFPMPVPLVLTGDRPAGTRVDVIASVDPDPRRWIEADWAVKLAADAAVVSGAPFETPVPIVAAAERPNPLGAGTQRIIVVGSGAWLLSYAADAARAIGGERVALTNPGNQELLLASVAWLAQLDDLIAPGPVSRQVARLDGVDGAAALRWGLLTVLATPGACLALGFVLWFFRRI